MILPSFGSVVTSSGAPPPEAVVPGDFEGALGAELPEPLAPPQPLMINAVTTAPPAMTFFISLSPFVDGMTGGRYGDRRVASVWSPSRDGVQGRDADTCARAVPYRRAPSPP